MKFKKGDNVIVLSGKDKGKSGKIERVFPRDSKVLIEGVNQFKRHLKAKRTGDKSEIVTITKPIGIAKVAIIDPKTKKASKIGFTIVKGEKTRISKKSGEKV